MPARFCLDVTAVLEKLPCCGHAPGGSAPWTQSATNTAVQTAREAVAIPVVAFRPVLPPLDGNPGAVPPTLGKGTRARNVFTVLRTRVRGEVRPTKATKLPLLG